ncbi:PAS domain S-box protein [Rubellimicrobium arenae]|uniref:PAS domain S-box protein n=1 Tax=Rubellimicrobium arenae TaxID=2817372 RepID=UPI001B30A150
MPSSQDLPPERKSRSGKPAHQWAGEVDFRALADCLPALVFVCDPQGSCIFTNRRVQEFTGLPAESWLGERWLDGLHPEDRPGAARAWAGAVATGEPYEIQYRLRSAEGDYAWHLVRATPLREDGRVMRWVGHATNIDDATREGAARTAALSAAAEQQAADRHSAEEFAARLIDATADCVKTLSLDGRVVSVNAAGLVALDVESPGPVLGRPWAEGWRATGFHLAAEAALDAARAGGTGRFVGFHRSPTGRGRWWNVAVTPVRDAHGAPERLLCVSRDVTEFKTATERFRLIAETVKEVFYQTDLLTGRVLYLSPAYASVWGRGTEEFEEDPEAFMASVHFDDRAKVRSALERQRQGEATRCEYRIIRPDGSLRHVRDLAYPIFDAEGRATQVVGAVEDITEVKDAQARAAAADEARFRGVFENVSVGIARVALDGRFLEVNGRFCAITGHDRDDLLAGGFQAITHPADLESDLAQVRSLIRGEREAYSLEKRYVTKAGGIVWVNLTVGLVQDMGGRPDHFVSVIEDITDRKGAETALARSLERAAVAQSAARAMLYEFVPGTDGVFRSETLQELIGWTPQEIGGKRDGWRRHIHPDDLSMFDSAVVAALASGDAFRSEYRVRHRDGRLLWVSDIGRIFRGPDGRVERMVGFVADITERREAEDRLRESETRLRLATDAADMFIWEADLAAGTLAWSANAARVIGCDPQELPCEVADSHFFAPSGKVRLDDALAGALTRRERTCRWEFEDRKGRHWQAVGLVTYGPDGRAAKLFGVTQDVTDRVRAGAALQASEARFRNLAETMPALVFVSDREGRNTYTNRRMQEYVGGEAERLLGDSWTDTLHPDDRVRAAATWEASWRSGQPYAAEYRVRNAEGTYRWHLFRGSPLRDDHGSIVQWIGAGLDIHDAVEAREALRQLNTDLEARVAERTASLMEAARLAEIEVKRREEVQTNLVQAQKMEALGQLVGGVAHDFNNVLTAVQGSFSLLERRVDDQALRRIIEEGRKAGDRAAALVRQMLAFARREAPTLRVIRPSDMLPNLTGMICHAVGPRVACVMDVEAGVWPVLADPQQLELALLNLAVNARDAMPEGGTLTVSARNRSAGAIGRAPGGGPGDEVEIIVADTGSGMDDWTIAHAFEPFFTTKEAGKGTGFGLAQVHGFALANQGSVHIDSTPGQGTKVLIRLPRSQLDVDAQASTLGSAAAGHGGATILLVDDDDRARAVTAAYLRDLDYSVLEASDATEALAIAQGGAVNLLLTDLIMQGTDGLTLANAVRSQRGDLPVLFLTGHMDERTLDGEMVVAKPFRGEDLAERILDVLGRA